MAKILRKLVVDPPRVARVACAQDEHKVIISQFGRVVSGNKGV